MAGPTIADAGEFGRIAAITEGLRSPPTVTVGVGDDCAVFAPTGQVAVSTDAMIEDVHFRKTWSSPHDVGRKAVASSVADLEAMGARPIGVVISLSAPPDLEASWVTECSRGAREECELSGAALVGGDITRGATIGVVCTVFGDMEAVPARPEQ